MIVTCPDCRVRFDDAYRWTICPHETFAANDGQNNFAHHPEAHLSPPTTAALPQSENLSPQVNGGLSQKESS
jgi:hypothetical protein